MLQVVEPAGGALTAMLVAVTAPLVSALPWTTAHLPTASASDAAVAVLVYVVVEVTVTDRSVVWLVVGSVTRHHDDVTGDRRDGAGGPLTETASACTVRTRTVRTRTVRRARWARRRHWASRHRWEPRSATHPRWAPLPRGTPPRRPAAETAGDRAGPVDRVAQLHDRRGERAGVCGAAGAAKARAADGSTGAALADAPPDDAAAPAAGIAAAVMQLPTVTADRSTG